jgi:peptide/nickel transport system substrate-binding protein
MSLIERIDRRRFMAGGAAFGASLLVGCGQGGEGRGQTPAGALDDLAPHYGGRLRLGIIDGDQAGNLDAHKPVGSGGTIRGFALYAKLWEWSADMLPVLALAEETEVSADATSWTLRLKPGLEFHHGKTISADDVVFSILRLTDPELASPYAGLVSAVDRDRVVKLDERTVRVHFKEGRGFIVLPDTWVNFGGIVPTDYHPVTNPVGAGPYKLKEFLPGRRSLFTRFENYFKTGRPYADELEIIDFKDQNSRLSALQNGQIDLANAIAPEHLALLERDARASVLVSETYGWQSFDMNLSKPPFDDARVREAFRLLADRDELVKRALNGQGRIANDLYSPQDPAFNHGIVQRGHDLEKAKALLKAAGHDRLSLDIIVGAAGTNAALVLSEQARRAGVTLTVKKVDAATFGGPQRLQWPISTGGSLGQSFLSTGLHVDAPSAVSNKTQFYDARFGELFTQALAQPDLERRRPLVHEAQRIQHERGGLLIWGFANTLDGISSRVGGAQAEHSHFPTWRFDKLWLKPEAA